MARTATIAYGLVFTSISDYNAAVLANGGVTLNLSMDAAIAAYPTGNIVQYGILAPDAGGRFQTDPFYSGVPGGTATLGHYSLTYGTPGVVYSPNTLSSATLTTSVTITAYGSYSNVLDSEVWSISQIGTLGHSAGPFVPATTPAFTGIWQQQVVTYTGDGNPAHAIATSFDLTVGVVSVWIFPSSGSFGPVYRNSSMSGTWLNQVTNVIDTTHGIVGFSSTGFTVTDNNGQGVDCNQNGHGYTAVVMSDTTSDNRYMRVGSYPGTADASKTITVPIWSVAPTRQLTQLWILGRSGTGVFCADNTPAGDSYSWAAEAKDITNMVTALGAGTFTVGNDNNVDNNGIAEYYYVAFALPIGNAIRNIFQTYTGLGNGSPIAISLAFTPAFAMVRDGTTTPTTPGAAWRGPTQTGTTSVTYLGGAEASGGIEALGTNSITIGITSAPNTVHCYGWAMASAGATAPVVPTYLPPPNLPPPVVGLPLNFTIGGGFSIQWLMEQFELKQRNEEHL